MSAAELFARLTDEWPAAEPVVSVVVLADDLLPRALAPVEPVAFALAALRAAWGAKCHDN
jgi:hypothetical protein